MLSRFIQVERLIHSIKTVIACLLGLLFTKLIGPTAEQWVIITIVVVMCAQIYVGSVMQKSYLRFLGTLVGCLFATITILTLGTTSAAITIAIALSSFIFSYLATKNESLTYAGTLGAVTTAIIMLGPEPTIPFALERFLEISLGVLIATVVSQFVLPIHASVHLRRAQADTLRQVTDYYKKIMAYHFSKQEEIDMHEMDEDIVKSLLKQRQLAKESKNERLGPAFSTEHFMQSLYAEREILRAMTFMHLALEHDPIACGLFTQSAAAKTFNEGVLNALEALITAINLDGAEPARMQIPSIKDFKEELQQNTVAPLPDQMVYLDGFLFSAEVLTNSLATLADLYRVSV